MPVAAGKLPAAAVSVATNVMRVGSSVRRSHVHLSEAPRADNAPKELRLNPLGKRAFRDFGGHLSDGANQRLAGQVIL